jgi:hypothetical protein
MRFKSSLIILFQEVLKRFMLTKCIIMITYYDNYFLHIFIKFYIFVNLSLEMMDF